MIRAIAFAALPALALTATTVSASAADLGPYTPRAEPAPYVEAPAFYSWRGFYVGVNGGYAWGAGDPIIVSGGAATGALSAIDPDGWLGGGQVGYNAQFNNVVLGVEADLQGGDVSGSSVGALANGSPAVASSELNWLSTVRLRAGLSADRVLFYVTAGGAWADLDYRLAAADGTSFRGGDTLSGYTVGGGVEWALAPGWSAKAEYLYVDLGSTTIAGFDGAGAPAAATFDNDFHIVRAGLNYKF